MNQGKSCYKNDCKTVYFLAFGMKTTEVNRTDPYFHLIRTIYICTK